MRGKVGMVFIASVVSLVALGVGYATLTDTLYMEGYIKTGYIDIEFKECKSNDPMWWCTCNHLDPIKCGEWNFETWTWYGERWDKDQASIDCCVYEDTLSIYINNAYPHYWGSVAFNITNQGSLLTQLNFKITAISKDGAVIGVEKNERDLLIGHYYGLKIDVEQNSANVEHLGTYIPEDAFENYDFILYIWADKTLIERNGEAKGYVCIGTAQPEGNHNYYLSILVEGKAPLPTDPQHS